MENVHYVVVTADNIGNDIYVSPTTHPDINDAKREMEDIYTDLMDSIDEDEVEWSEKTDAYYRICITNGDYYYANIKSIKVIK